MPVKINLGCGTNKLAGWNNYDAEIDISIKLPFKSDTAQFILAEHVVEHVSMHQAMAFFKECYRVLAPGGVVRIAVPSVEQVMMYADDDYMKFVSKWTGGEVSLRAAMGAILHAHGHQMAWTESLLRASLFYAGFERLQSATPGQSVHEELRGVEGHGKVIGEHFNFIETIICEGTK